MTEYRMSLITRVSRGSEKSRIPYTGIVILLIFLEHRPATSLKSNYMDEWVSDSTVVCNVIPGLTKEQRALCYRNPEDTVAALKGLQIAIAECQYQFTWHRWNCSSLTMSSGTQKNNVLLQRGYQETAFAYAISAAGVTHSVARACGKGRLISCGCGSSSTEEKVPAKAQGTQWKWAGCSHNLDYGVEFSRQFLDTNEKTGDIRSTVNLHNNQAGRLAVLSNIKVRCRCHGISGFCELKTCWKVVSDFRVVGKMLKDRYSNAILVAQSNNGNVIPFTRIRELRGRRRDRHQRQINQQNCVGNDCKFEPTNLSDQLFYYQKSPNFCERDELADFPGTSGRRCNHKSPGIDGCELLCCGRGYNVVEKEKNERCRSAFHWSKNCRNVKWFTICK